MRARLALLLSVLVLGGAVVLIGPPAFAGAGVISLHDWSDTEGETFFLVLTMDTPQSSTVTVDYATSDGTATAGSDYTAASGTITLAAGETSYLGPNITTLGDSTDESDETFTVTLSNVTGPGTVSDSSYTMTITDDDEASSGGGGGGGGSGGGGGGGGGTPSGGTISFSASTYSVAEQTPPARLTITRTGVTSGTVGVNYRTTDGTASASIDYGMRNTSVQFPTGVTSATVNIPIFNDTATEGNETFTVTLSSPTGGGTLGSITVATVTIVDDEAPVASATPTPTPSATIEPEPVEPETYVRALTLRLKRHLKARGVLSVTSGPAECIADLRVKIQKKKATGGWKTIERDKTNDLGVYSARIPDKKGTYRAKIARTTLDELNLCGAATSAKKKHRH